MALLDPVEATLTPGIVVELASGHTITIDRDRGENFSIGAGGVLTVITVEQDRSGARLRRERRYSPAAWISTSEITATGSASQLATSEPR